MQSARRPDLAVVFCSRILHEGRFRRALLQIVDNVCMLLRLQFLALLVAPFWLVAADDSTTRIKVEVQSLSGKPVDRASVVVDFVEGRSIAKLGKKVMKHWEVRTNQEGIAKIPALPTGKIRIQVIAKGYQTFGQVYEVEEADRAITVKLNPPQPQHTEHQ